MFVNLQTVPEMANQLPTVKCAQLVCRLGCVCDSMEVTYRQNGHDSPSTRRSSQKGSEYTQIKSSACGRQNKRRRGSTSPNSSSSSPSKSISQIYTEEQHEEEAILRPAVDTAAKSYDSQQNRKYVEVRLNQIKQKLKIPQPNQISGFISPKSRGDPEISFGDPHVLGTSVLGRSKEVSVASSSMLFSDQCANQLITPPVTPFAIFPDLPSEFTQFTEAQQQMKENEPATPPEDCVFPNVVTSNVISVLSNGNMTRRLKIILQDKTGQHRSPSRASMLLPLPNTNDQWGLVALDHIPESGFQVPGLSVFIPGDLLGRVASTAIERKARVSLRFKLKNKESAFNPGCCVYGTSQLPRHVFVGPFPVKYFENCSSQPYMVLIASKKPAPLHSVCSTEPTTSTLSSAETVKPEVLVTAEEVSQKDEQSGGNFAASTDQETAVVANIPMKTPKVKTEFPKAIESQMAAYRVENDKMEIAREAALVEGPPFPSGPFNPDEMTKI